MARPSPGTAGLSSSALDDSPWRPVEPETLLPIGGPAPAPVAPVLAVPLPADPAPEGTSERPGAPLPVDAALGGVPVEGDLSAPGRRGGVRRRAALVNGGRLVGRVGRASVAVLGLAAVWEVLPRLDVVDATFLPPLSEVLTAWVELLRGGELVDHVQASLTRSLAGFGLAILVAIPLGLAIGWYRPVAELLNPVLELFRNTAALALLPVFVLVLGLGETSKISIIVYACSWPILLNTIAGVKGVDPLLIKSARSMGLGAAKLFQKVILPAAVPTVFTGIRLAGAYSILVLVAAEMVGAKAGLGYLINYAQYNFRVPDMYAGIITISVLGLLFNAALVRFERRFSTWRTT